MLLNFYCPWFTVHFINTSNIFGILMKRYIFEHWVSKFTPKKFCEIDPWLQLRNFYCRQPILVASIMGRLWVLVLYNFSRQQFLTHCNKFWSLPLPFTSTLVYLLLARQVPTRVERLTGLNFISKFLSLPTNIRPGWRWMEVANTLACYDTTTITAVKKFKSAGLMGYPL